MSGKRKSVSIAAPPLIDATMFAIRRRGDNSPSGPRKFAKSHPGDATGTRPAAPVAARVSARVSAAALALMHAGEQAGADALLTIIAGDLSPAFSYASAGESHAQAHPGAAGPPAAAPPQRGPRPRVLAWHAEAERLRRQGLSIRALAERFCRTESAVAYALARLRKRALQEEGA